MKSFPGDLKEMFKKMKYWGRIVWDTFCNIINLKIQQTGSIITTSETNENTSEKLSINLRISQKSNS